jgi:hypothetical protein
MLVEHLTKGAQAIMTKVHTIAFIPMLSDVGGDYRRLYRGASVDSGGFC